jgi:hypothetical protein
VWPNLGSVAFAYTIGMIGKTRKPMSTTKCVCAVTHIEKECALQQAQRVCRASAVEGFGAFDGLGCGPSPRRSGRGLTPHADAPNQSAPIDLVRQDQPARMGCSAGSPGPQRP